MYNFFPIVANVTKLPEIRHGMKCIYGKTYKMDCNTCRCGHRNTLLCTKAACLIEMNSEIIATEKNQTKTENTHGLEKKKRRRKIKRRGNKKDLRVGRGQLLYPPLPIGTTCIPGRIYQEKCKRCICKSERIPICSVLDACNKPPNTRVSKPEDVRPPVKDKEFRLLAALPHAAAPCVPGTTYKVDCNVCVCDEMQNLICDKLLCISFAEMHRTEAMKRSGLPCNIDNGQENEVIQSKCVKCSCNQTTFCEAIDNCVSDAEKSMRTYGTRRNGSRLTFDYNTQKCIPDHIYKDNCNKCYCQKDLTLRCTQKTCLNYKQATVLEKQQQYLQEHGL